MRLTHLSLCSGIGGIDLAAERAGFETAAQCEIDEYASKVLAKNFKGVPNLHDIRTVTNERLKQLGIGTPTVVSAGFPCQPYSLAGKGLGDRDVRDLWGEVARVLGEIRPKWFVGENTPGLFARNNQRYFRRILDDLASLGYTVGWGIWGACDVGAPHRRDRVFIVARNADCDDEKKEPSIFNGKNAESCGVYRKVSDALGKRRDSNEIQRRELEKSRNEKNAGRVQARGMQFERICCSIPDANGERVGKYGIESNRGKEKNEPGEWWKTEPDVGRMAYGIPARMDRLKCLGNAVVPHQIYPIFEKIAEIELE
nr:MAG TPA: Cytosine specific methyltransferase [Caudoviricetes sp.]